MFLRIVNVAEYIMEFYYFKDCSVTEKEEEGEEDIKLK